MMLRLVEEISEQELKMWEGAKHYVWLHPVINPNSATAPFRITTNNSLSDPDILLLNSIPMKGHHSLSD